MLGMEAGVLCRRIASIQVGLTAGIHYARAVAGYEDIAGGRRIDGLLHTDSLSLVMITVAGDVVVGISCVYAGKCQLLSRSINSIDHSSGRSNTMKMKHSTWNLGSNVLAMLLVVVFCSCSEDGVGPDKTESPLKFSSSGTVQATIHGGTADLTITASGGTMPYEFYVIPETQWTAGDLMNDMLTRNDFSRLHRYTYSRQLFGSQTITLKVRPGTTTVPRYYWVAVQDDAENATISGSNMLTWWKRVAAYDL